MAKTQERTLNKKQLAYYEGMLKEKAAELRQNLGTSKAARALSKGEDVLDEEDMPGHSHEEWIFLNRNSLDVMLLRQIDEALRRIQDGSYGICQECDEPIMARRLDAIPWAGYCVPCQEELAALEDNNESGGSPFMRLGA